MARRFRLDFSTAYGQLILLVFLPISVLAMVGGVLVLYDTSRAGRIIQKANADTLLNQYQTFAYDYAKDLQQINQNLSQNLPNSSENIDKNLSKKQLAELQQSLLTPLQNTIQDPHLQGFLIVNDNAQILLSFGNIYPLDVQIDDNIAKTRDLLKNANNHTPTSDFYLKGSLSNHPTPAENAVMQFLSHFSKQDDYLLDTGDSTLYAKSLILSENHEKTENLWIVVNVDNEPLKIARYQVLLALAITGLLTILLLLLSIHVYARRWITPIYEMRLHLQRTNANNLYKPMTVNSSGEINQLQQDLVKTLRRLHTSFQDLKNHAEQTEDDLRLAFDEMEMQNISIRNARDAAVSASQTKSAFLANISHELRTPLNSIDGFINLLSRHGGLTHEQDLYVQTIRKSSAHLLALVNDVLDFSKIEAGKLILDNHELDLYATIYDVVDMLSPVSAEKGLRLAVFFYDDVPRYLLGDALRIKQVLTNLVNNAIKFTDEGEVLVRVSLDDIQDNTLHISVQDTGRGIDPQHQKLLFQSFSQGDPSITRQYGGTGLGLVISKQLSYLMGGEIGFFDNTDSHNSNSYDNHDSHSIGSTFWFTLPIAISEQQRTIDETSFFDIWEVPKHLQPMDLTNNSVKTKPLQILVWIEHHASLQVLRGSLQNLAVVLNFTNSLSHLLEMLNEPNSWDWVLVDKGVAEDTASLLSQIRRHYSGKLALFAYHVNLDPALLQQFQVQSLYQPLDRRQLYQLLDDNPNSHTEPNLPQWQGACVLAVDDHLPNLLVIEALLNELGVAVVTANSGFEAVEYMRNSLQLSGENNNDWQKIDLIFMDIQMPKMSGKQASLQIRHLEKLTNEQHHRQSHTPIVALTAHSLSDERAKLLSAGIDDYVGKPINQTQLIQVLQHWLTNNQQRPRLSDKLKSPSVEKRVEKNEKRETTENLEKITDLAVIDWQDALNRVAGKADLASNLLMLMIETSGKDKVELMQAWQAHDREMLANIAHRILGASRYTGVPQLRHASQHLEDKCLLNVQNTSPTQFAMLSPYYDALVQALDNLIGVDTDDYPMLKTDEINPSDANDMAWKMI
ncbi:ATP-binding protein [Faucicola boevrei]|uniref:ATP-binding protein n=1 Tax=Faucicola boevrei TaxID=346665 RepID=UPI0004774D5E|nr:ATP-binding protein [Moraxella boevrei]